MHSPDNDQIILATFHDPIAKMLDEVRDSSMHDGVFCWILSLLDWTLESGDKLFDFLLASLALVMN